MNLDKSKYFFSFQDDLESLLMEYLKKKKGKEVFLSILGSLVGKEYKVHYRIEELIPFPNLSPNANMLVEPPPEWISVTEERRLFLNESLVFLGFIHSHPHHSSKKSILDDHFGLTLLNEFNRPMLMIIIGTNSNLRCYLIDVDTTKVISGEVKLFNLKKNP